MKKLLLAIKRLFLVFGIEIRFVKKNKGVSAIHLNDVDTVNKAWSNSKIEKLFYSKEVQKFYENIIATIKKHIQPSHRKFIDVGCGTGNLLNLLVSKIEGIDPSGMEYSSAALDIAKKNYPNSRFILHDINNPFFEKFDVVLSTEVLEHILYPERALANLLNMLNPNSILFISVPNGRIDTFEGHINFWSPESWKAFIEKNTNSCKTETGPLNERILYALIFN